MVSQERARGGRLFSSPSFMNGSHTLLQLGQNVHNTIKDWLPRQKIRSGCKKLSKGLSNSQTKSSSHRKDCIFTA
eukprot:4944895-Amphidinium_carterae.1